MRHTECSAFLDARRIGVILVRVTQKEKPIAIRDLYPHCSDTQVQLAEKRWHEYLTVVMVIHERIQSDPETYKRFRVLTGRD